jgi:outer membrane protein assembly factor BamB
VSLRAAVGAIVILALAAAAGATDWPHWRGPNYNGSTDETDLPERWSKTENVAWTAPLPGPGAGTPIVAGGRVFVSSMAKKGVVAMCLDAATGKVVWEKPVGKGGRVKRHTLASPSPVTDGKRVYFLYGSGALAGFSADGEELWQRNLTKETGRWRIMHVYGASPLLHAGKIYVAVIHRASSGVLALDPESGQTLWKQPRSTGAKGESMEAYTTPVPYTGKGPAGVVVAGADAVTLHDPATGRELWRVGYGSGRNWRLVPTPAVADGVIVCLRPFANPAFGISVGSGRPRIAWTQKKTGADVCSPAYRDGLAYVLDDKHKKLTCLDAASGKVHWQEKAGKGTLRASPTVADGKVYTIDEKSNIDVFQAGKTAKKLAGFSLGERGCWSTISVADGRMYLRSDSRLYCIRKGGKSGEASEAGGGGSSSAEDGGQAKAPKRSLRKE